MESRSVANGVEGVMERDITMTDNLFMLRTYKYLLQKVS